MTTEMKTVTDHTEYRLLILERILAMLKQSGLIMNYAKPEPLRLLYLAVAGKPELLQESTLITSATSASGTEIGESPFSTETLGDSLPKSTPAEPTGSDEPSTGDASGSE